MIPGIAEIQIRTSTPGVKQIKIVPLYIVGEGSKYPPPPDVLLPSKDDPQFFSGKLWLMASGSWQVRVEADGDAGSGTIAVPVPAAARSTMPMQKGLGALLAALMVLLVAGIVSIIGAARREGQLEPGQQVGPAQKRAARLVMAGAFVIVAAVLVGGAFWWKTAAANLSNRMIYTAPDTFRLARSRRPDAPAHRRFQVAHTPPRNCRDDANARPRPPDASVFNSHAADGPLLSFASGAG